MKKILSIAMATIVTAAAASAAGIAATVSSASAAEESAAVYLVPGEGNLLEGAEEADAAALNIEGKVYKAGAAGTELPTPTTERKDEDGNAFVFQGWWYIEDASVTYTKTVPDVAVTTYLYTDFRAPLSQHRDPAPPKENPSVALGNHMHIIHTDTGEEEDVLLRVSGTDFATAEQARYGHAVQWFNEYFELRPGDRVQFWLAGLNLETPQCMPLTVWNGSGFYKAGYEFAVSGSNKTADYLEPFNNVAGNPTDSAFKFVDEPTFSYKGKQAQHFRIYIKMFDSGSWLNIYLEKK